MVSSTETEGTDLSFTFAPIYWGFVLSLILGGITIVQGYIYFFSTQKDRTLVWLTAILMLVLDLVSSVLIAQSVYYYLIPHFGSLRPLNSVTSELSAECLVSTSITFISQMYFVYQLYVVKHLAKGRWFVVGSLTICAFLAFAGGVACVVTMFVYRHGVLANRNDTFAIFFGIAKGFGTLTDVLATVAMCMYLTSARTAVSQTNNLLNRIVAFIIHRGALVTLIQTLLLITFYALPHNLCWFAFHINVTKLYANTFFAMLNGRNHYKKRRFAQSSALRPNLTSTRNTLKRGDNGLDLCTFDLQDDHVSGITKTVTVEVAEI